MKPMKWVGSREFCLYTQNLKFEILFQMDFILLAHVFLALSFPTPCVYVYEFWILIGYLSLFKKLLVLILFIIIDIYLYIQIKKVILNMLKWIFVDSI